MGCRADLRNQSVPSQAHQAAFCFTLRRLLPPPNVIMLPTHPITSSRVARAAASKQRRHRQGCACSGLRLVPELTLSLTHTHACVHTHAGSYWLKRIREQEVMATTRSLCCAVTTKIRGNKTKSQELCGKTTWGKSKERHLEDLRL